MGNIRTHQALPVPAPPEIVELDEHLDMAFDPLRIVVEIIPTNCDCWCPPPG
jgi:hypothetical protein